MKTILMANSQKAFSKSLFEMLESRYGGVRLLIAKDDDMGKWLKKKKFDLAIVNSSMNALALSKELIVADLSILILVYTETNHLPYIKKLYKLGVSGVIASDAGDHEILKAVTDVLAKRIYLSENLKQQLIGYTTVEDNDTEVFDENVLFKKEQVDNFIKRSYVSFTNNSIVAYTHCLN